MPRVFEDPVTIGDIAFNTDVADANGVRWLCDGLDGWEDSVVPIINSQSNGYTDGVTVSEYVKYGARFVNLQGVVVAPNRTVATTAWRKLQGMLAAEKKLTAYRYGPWNERLEVQVSDAVTKVKDIGSAFRFNSTLMAPWPFKTSIPGTTKTSGIFNGTDYVRQYPRTYPMTYDVSSAGALADTINIANEGNARAYPISRVTGPLLAGTWYIINDNKGETTWFQSTLSSGKELVIDSLNSTATIAGVPVDYYLRGAWPTIAAESTFTFKLFSGDDNPDARLSMDVHNTWR